MGGGSCLHETLVKCFRWSLGWGGDVGLEIDGDCWPCTVVHPDSPDSEPQLHRLSLSEPRPMAGSETEKVNSGAQRSRDQADSKKLNPRFLLPCGWRNNDRSCPLLPAGAGHGAVSFPSSTRVGRSRQVASGALSWVALCGSGCDFRDSIWDMEGCPFPMEGHT